MTRLRLRLRFNPGRDGAPLDRLGELAVQAEKFLRAFSGDLGINAKKGEWLASTFTNESVAYDVIYAEPVSEVISKNGNKIISQLAGDDPVTACGGGDFSYRTLAEFARIGRGMSPDDKFLVGVYESDSANEPHWLSVSYRKTAEIREFLEAPYIVYGAVQGTFHGWTPGADPPFFQLRPLDNSALVKCVCTPDQYKMVHAATGEPNAVLIVAGDLSYNRSDESIAQVDVSHVEQVRQLSDDEFERLNGLIPGATGNIGTDEYITQLHEGGSGDE